jgi:hypothetical protein
LKQKSGSSTFPHLYERDQTFWLPQTSNYFILHRTTKPRPSQLYNPRFFYWDPDCLLEGGLKCPLCKASLRHHGYARPRRVVDLENCFYMIGQRHICPQCKNPKTNEHSVTFNSWDPRILAMLPTNLAAEFPADLSHRGVISTDVGARWCSGNTPCGAPQLRAGSFCCHNRCSSCRRFDSRLHLKS